MAGNSSRALDVLLNTGRTFYAPLADAGSGAVSLVANGAGASQAATFTRATAATAANSAGLVASVSSGVARAYYDPLSLRYGGYLPEGARTNLCLQSEDFATTWTNIGTPVTTVNSAIAPDGTTTADTIQDDSATEHEGKAQAVAVPNDSATRVVSLFVKKGSGIALLSLVFSGGTRLDYQVQLDTATGLTDVSQSTTAVAANNYGAEEFPEYWRVWVAGANNTLGNTSSSIEFYPAITGVLGNAYAVATVGSQIVWGAQNELGSFPSSYIPTTTAAVTRDIDVDSYPTSGNVIAASGTLCMDFTPLHAPSGTVFLWGTYVDANNYTALLHDATNLIMRKRIAGVNYDATRALAFVDGTVYKVAGTWGAAGVKIAIDSVVGTPHANTTAAQIGSTMQIGADGNSANAPFAGIKNVRIWQAQFSDEQLRMVTR